MRRRGDEEKTKVQCRPIGVIESPFKERFGIPRQAGLVTAAAARLCLLPPFASADAVRGLSEFSHVWIIFRFVDSELRDGQVTVRPPRLGGNERLGVFATRSPFRPNSIGMSAVRLLAVDVTDGQVCLQLAGGDFLDGTEVLDIKPYVPYADSIPTAQAGFATQAPSAALAVEFSAAALAVLHDSAVASPQLRALIVQTLQLDPRPAYHVDEKGGRQYGIRLYDFDVKWIVAHNTATVIAIDTV